MAETELPEGLIDILLEFTTSALVNMPADFAEFASKYFTRLNEKKLNENKCCQGGAHCPRVKINVESDSDNDDDFNIEVVARKVGINRRPTVFAEQYDPEADDDDDDDMTFDIIPKDDEEKERLNNKIKNILLFRNLSEYQMDRVLEVMELRDVYPGQTIIKQGDDGDYFYVIDSGVYHIYITVQKGTKKLIGQLDNAGSFGELALLYNQPRSATIEAATAGKIWALDRHSFRKILLRSAYKQRLQYEEFLSKLEILKSLEPYERSHLCDALVSIVYKDKDIIFKQGDKGDGMFFVEDGTVSIHKRIDSTNMEMCKLGKGRYFGELALVTKKPRAASAIAVGKTRLAFLDVEAFERLMGPCMKILLRNIDNYEAYIADMTSSSSNI